MGGRSAEQHANPGVPAHLKMTDLKRVSRYKSEHRRLILEVRRDSPAGTQQETTHSACWVRGSGEGGQLVPQPGDVMNTLANTA